METIFGELQIDRAKGTIWFNSSEYGICVLRICNIPKEKLREGVMCGLPDQMIDLRIE